MEQLNELVKSIEISNKNIIILISTFKCMENQISRLTNNNADLEEELKIKNKEIEQLNNILLKSQLLLGERDSEFANFKKVSMLQSVNKQLDEKLNYIKILESQLEKERQKNKTEQVESSEKPKVESSEKPKVESSEKPKVESSEKPKVESSEKPKIFLDSELPFDPENFEEINGYELLAYKKKYYLRDLETDELYSIQNNMPHEVAGLLTSKGKVKLH
jgi:hypothetical protein